MEMATFIGGLVLGIITAGLLLRKRISDAATIARSEGQLELVTLNERLNSAGEEAKRLNGVLSESERQSSVIRQQLDAARNESAQLLERSTRVPILEQDLRTATAHIEELNQQISDLRQKNGASESTISSQGQDIARLTRETQELATRRDQQATELQNLASQLTAVSTTLASEQTQNEERLAQLNDAHELFSNQFKALANDILEEKSKRFTEQNQTNIGQLLEPLKVKLSEFQGKVEEVYIKEGQERSALAQQVKTLMDLNKQLSDDAHDLTRALKGSSKTQGNWGEMILERILESSGLRKGQEYEVQESHTREDGSRAQPDVIIHLPEDRHMVIDAKVSLTAYEEYVNADDDSGRATATKRHIDSIQGHIKELAEKNYQDIHGVKSLDFVIMFIPVEPAFMLAISQNSKLWQDAWLRNVLLVSPSTLLFVVRTVAHLWRQEQQKNNAQEIAKRGAELYDKLVGFVGDMKNLGTRLKQAQTDYDNAMGKFVEGKGNVIRQAEMLKELGIKPGKTLPQDVLDASIERNSLPTG